MLLLPALASVIALVAGRWQGFGIGDVDRPESRLWRFAALLVIALIGAITGYAVYQGRAQGVGIELALKGALLGAFGTSVPLLMYYALGYRIRGPIVASLVWAASLFPLYLCALALLVGVAGLAGCPPNAYECPL